MQIDLHLIIQNICNMMCWCRQMYLGSSSKIYWIPCPWCTSQSTIRTLYDWKSNHPCYRFSNQKLH